MIQLHRCVVGTGAQGLPLDHGTIPRELRPFVDLPSSLSRTQSQPTEQKGGTAAKNSKVPQSRMAGELVSVTGEWLKRRAEEASAAVKVQRPNTHECTMHCCDHDDAKYSERNETLSAVL